ncbi:MAG: hypothetical protein JSU63_18165 [Phycisphaerales bacterium]|nr:MAG: hypothetical protein JSU63_18165 [Phycisphaerales bacterium]
MKARVISLDGLKMNAVETDANGVIGVDTIFKFRQTGEYVSAEYAGGKIRQGYLVGLASDTKLVFSFCQLESDGTLNSGKSTCNLEIGNTGLVRIIENFEWASRQGGGKNVIQELRSHRH